MSTAHVYVEYTRADDGLLERGHRVVLSESDLAEYPHRERLVGWPEGVVYWAALTGPCGGIAPASKQAQAALDATGAGGAA